MFDHSRRPVPDRSGTVLKVPQSDLPLDRWRPGAALAVIAGTQGPAYRPVSYTHLTLPTNREV